MTSKEDLLNAISLNSALFNSARVVGPAIAGLVRKGRAYSLADQDLVIAKEREFLGRVLPEYAAAAQRGAID